MAGTGCSPGRVAKGSTTTIPLYPALSRLASDGAMSDTTERLEDLVRTSVRAEIDDLRRFLDRRIAELSMEIHATVQLVDYSEINLSAKLASIHEQIALVVAKPAAATYNSGVELEAVVQATENAANKIMEAAEAIGSWLQTGGDPAALPVVTQQVNAIFEACTFQDLTGQRIRRAIEHLQQVETMLSGMIDNEPAGQPAARAAPDLDQTDIDSMFS
jgi:chemotaxis protein CheZ